MSAETTERRGWEIEDHHHTHALDDPDYDVAKDAERDFWKFILLLVAIVFFVLANDAIDTWLAPPSVVFYPPGNTEPSRYTSSVTRMNLYAYPQVPTCTTSGIATSDWVIVGDGKKKGEKSERSAGNKRPREQGARGASGPPYYSMEPDR